jgi:serine/threonine protein kinase
MSAEASSSHVERDPIEVLAESFLERFRRGELPSVEEYAAQHPQLSDEIRELLPALVQLEEGMSVSGESTGSHHCAIRAETLRGAPRHLGDYTILREVGRGGMGVVYEAVQQSLGRHVALKVLPWHQIGESSQLQRFQLEARAAAKLHHTNIVPVFGVGEDDGVHYYAMQFIHGQGLDNVIAELRKLRGGGVDRHRRGEDAGGWTVAATIAQGFVSGRFQGSSGHDGGEVPGPPKTEASTERGPGEPGEADATSSASTSGLSRSTDCHYYRQAARIGLQVAEGLAYAHDQGILHRDIKPSNLLMDTRGTVWISDFGLAKAEGSDGPTRTGDIVGTFRYMAPERFEGKADRRSDVYALGATLYELITLRPLHGECDRARLVERILREPPAPPRSLDRRIPRDLETMVLKALDKDPQRRYASAAAMADDLRRFEEGRPITARQIAFWERLGMWARRRPAIAAMALVVNVLLATLLGTGIWSYVEINRSLDVARDEGRKSKASATAATLAGDSATEAARISKERAADLTWQDYINRVNRAYREVMDDNLALAEDLLFGCPQEHRGWEWHYVMRLCNMERLNIVAPGQTVNAIAYSPDGSLIAIGSGRSIIGHNGRWKTDADKAHVEIRETTTGRLLRTISDLKGPP